MDLSARARRSFISPRFFRCCFRSRASSVLKAFCPRRNTLPRSREQLGPARFWFAPSLFWISASSGMLMAVTWLGLLASIAAFRNLWPRLSFFICCVCFLSFVGASGVFSSYQSDGMLLEAGFISLFFAPRGAHAGLGREQSALARQLVSAAMGVVPHLLRIGHGEAGERRSAVAQLYGHGRVLPERPAAHVDRLVRRASAALVPRGHGGRNAGAGAGNRLHAVLSRAACG